jgi:hypothetical protein
MGLFSRKPKEYVFDQKTGCAVCKQSVLDELYYKVTFVDLDKRDRIVSVCLLHTGQTCFNKSVIEKLMPDNTVALITKHLDVDHLLAAKKSHRDHLLGQIKR